jgi:G3E family GTPase
MLLQFSSSAQGAGRPWEPEEKRICKLVFIGKHLNRQELTDGFTSCMVPSA